MEPTSGHFRTYEVDHGAHTLVVEAPGYETAEVPFTLKSKEEQLTVRLNRREIKPGIVQGTLTSVRGKKVTRATILIPEVDRTVNVNADGDFHLELPPGLYKAVVSAPGYRTQHKSFRVVEGGTVIFNVELHK